MPFGDMKAMIDPPTADLAGRLLEMMGAFGYDAELVVRVAPYAFSKKNKKPMVRGGDVGV